MKNRILGKTGLNISEIGFGCWAIGGNSYGFVKDEDSMEALNVAWDHGVRFFDTADVYGHGHSEEVLGKFLVGKPRGEAVVATKVGNDFYQGALRKNFDADYIRMACDQSLKRLKVDTLDLYQLHNPTIERLEKSNCLETLEELKRAGKIRHIGVSVFSEEEALYCLRDERVEALQIVVNMIDQKMTEHVLPESKARNVGIIAREPLACGLLTGKYTADSVFGKNDHRAGWSRETKALELNKLEAVQRVLATHRMSLVRAALEYVLEFQEVSTVIPGIKTKEQCLENLLASEDPRLRSQEAYQIRELYKREAVFKQGGSS